MNDCKQGLIGQCSGSLEDSSVENNVAYRDLAQEVSEDNISMWARDYSCDTLAKNVTAFFLYPKNVSEAKLKSLGQILLAEEILR